MTKHSRNTKLSSNRLSNKLFRPATTWRSPLRVANFTLLFSIVGILFLVFSKAAPIAGFYGSVEQDQVNRINNARASNGKSGLQHIECLNAIAEGWTYKMAVDRAPDDPNENRPFGLMHNPKLANEVTYACNNSWSILGENVGVGYDSPSLFNAFMASAPHKANILDSRFVKTGLGAYYTSDGRLWVTQVFAKCVSCGGKWATNASLPADPVKPATVTGNVDVANCRRIAGWTYDKEASSTSNQVHIYIDGQGTNLGATSVYRGDVNSAFGITGNHGFDWIVPDSFRDGKTHTAYIYGINVTGGPNVLLAQKTLDACANPIGNVDGSNCSSIYGWTLDMNDPAKSIDVHIYIDGVGYSTGPANQPRGDVNAAYSAYGVTGNHGFNFATPARWKDGKQHTVNSFAINIGQGSTNPLIRATTIGPCY